MKWNKNGVTEKESQTRFSNFFPLSRIIFVVSMDSDFEKHSKKCNFIGETESTENNELCRKREYRIFYFIFVEGIFFCCNFSFLQYCSLLNRSFFFFHIWAQAYLQVVSFCENKKNKIFFDFMNWPLKREDYIIFYEIIKCSTKFNEQSMKS